MLSGGLRLCELTEGLGCVIDQRQSCGMLAVLRRRQWGAGELAALPIAPAELRLILDRLPLRPTQHRQATADRPHATEVSSRRCALQATVGICPTLRELQACERDARVCRALPPRPAHSWRLQRT